MGFGEYLKQLLKEKGMSASELARIMEYKSRNTVFRILAGEGGHVSRQAFFDRIVQDNVLDLTEEEKKQLTCSLEVSRVGAGRYMDNLAMEALFHAEKEKADIDVQVVRRDKLKQDTTLKAILEEYVSGSELELQISGCCSSIIFNTLRDVLLESGHKCRVSVVHYVYTGPEEIIFNIAAIQPMLFASCYQAYSIEPGVYSPEKERIYRSNCICAHVTHADGSGFDEAMLLTDAACMVRLGRRQRGGFHLADRLFDDSELKRNPIKSAFMLDSMTQGLVSYIDECRRIEQNCAIYTAKLDIPFFFIHPDLLVDAAKEGFCATGLATQEEMEQLIQTLYDIQLQRFENCYGKKKPTYAIFSREAMERFAKTGCQSDHFFAMRPFTRAERLRILCHIRDQIKKNSGFEIFFFKENEEPPGMEIGLYEGVGVLLSKPFTHYDSDHAEAIIAQKDFCQRYKSYFFEDLLARRVLSKARSLKVLEELIELVRTENQ